ncbi:hypothetical protein K470DRAFT_70792 [Piedraia hortae CBS 480.64]|uniref:F-box domain-containing protein n=1 Tax=Piedraia hortae CBS 480.64 TaxID=1314780 RepID=A0A6A7BZ68_9PEZI|nr:hypothetical protein K470DRAFT_70792 [Piedraia hortae CBS 480.64]
MIPPSPTQPPQRIPLAHEIIYPQSNPTPPKMSLLILPPEVRNAIYAFHFPPQVDPQSLSLLLVCKQIHREAGLLAFSRTNFPTTIPSPAAFASLTSTLTTEQISLIRYVTLTANVRQLRAMNEEWGSSPFGCGILWLRKLRILPQRSAVGTAELPLGEELSQRVHCATLVEILVRVLGDLEGVEVLEVGNVGVDGGKGPFGERVWVWGFKRLGERLEGMRGGVELYGDGKWWSMDLRRGDTGMRE